MTDLKYKQSINDLIYLCSCSVNGSSPEQKRIATLELDHLYEAAQKHMMASMVGQILQKAGIPTPAFKTAISMAQRRAVVLNNDLNNKISALEVAGIWYMPLKGSVLKDYYPSFAMREMSDIDILFDATHAEEVKTIMEGLGFRAKSFETSNDDDYIKPPLSNFEMHKALFGERHDKKLYEYYKNVKDRLLKDEGNQYGYHFKPEDFYIFMIAHEYKHYNMGGTGLRSLLDTYVFLRKNTLDMSYVEAETEKLGIEYYERQNRSLAQKLFSKDGRKLTAEEEKMFDYIIASGTYGTLEHKIDNTGGRIKYFIRRVFGPIGKNDPYREHFKKTYATFFNHPILLPFLPFYRLFRALKNSPKRIKAEANALRKSGKANGARQDLLGRIISGTVSFDANTPVSTNADRR